MTALPGQSALTLLFLQCPWALSLFLPPHDGRQNFTSLGWDETAAFEAAVHAHEDQ